MKHELTSETKTKEFCGDFEKSEKLLVKDSNDVQNSETVFGDFIGEILIDFLGNFQRLLIESLKI